jgi:hypothetical protein
LLMYCRILQSGHFDRSDYCCPNSITATTVDITNRCHDSVAVLIDLYKPAQF